MLFNVFANDLCLFHYSCMQMHDVINSSLVPTVLEFRPRSNSSSNNLLTTGKIFLIGIFNNEIRAEIIMPAEKQSLQVGFVVRKWN